MEPVTYGLGLGQGDSITVYAQNLREEKNGNGLYEANN